MIVSYKNQADYVISKCGGVASVCKFSGQPYHVVWGWVNRSASGHIPAEHQAQILIKAREAGIDLSERDMIFPPLAGSIPQEMVGRGA